MKRSRHDSRAPSAKRRKSLRRRRTLLAAFCLLVLTVTVLWFQSPFFRVFALLPVVVVKNESSKSLVDLARYIWYVQRTVSRFSYDERTGLKEFEPLPPVGDEDRDYLKKGWVEWHRGEFAAAVKSIHAHHEVRGESEESLFWLAMAYLRLGEERNCRVKLEHHGGPFGHQPGDHQRLCTLPLQAIHAEKSYSKSAAQAFRKLLDEYAPGNHVYRWLLNFSYMTIDAYPDEVPDEYRVDGNFVDHFYGEKKAQMEEKYSGLKLTDRASELGVDSRDAGRGVAVEDFDRDGDYDIVVGGFYTPLRFYVNDGERFVDKSRQSGLAAIKGTHVMTAADYDNDGWVDIFASRPLGSKTGDFVLMRNMGDGTFQDVTVASGLLPDVDQRDEYIFTWASAWGDLENDGDLDLFVANWHFYNSLEGRWFPFTHNMISTLYRNEGGNGDSAVRFVDVTAEYGLEPVLAAQNITGAAFGDYNNDGFTDLALTPQWIPGVLLLENQRGESFKLGPEVPHKGWGFMTSFVDVDHDGLLDLFVGGSGTAYGVTAQAVFGHGTDDFNSGTTIWLQNPDGTWRGGEEFFRGQMPITSMGCSFGDINNDGALDFYIGTGNPEAWLVLPNLMYMGEMDDGEATGFLDNISMLHGLGNIQKGHSIVFFDYDDDGDQDIYSSLGGLFPGDEWPNQFFVNDSTSQGNWTKIRLQGTRSNYYGLGARIEVVAARPDGRTVSRHYLMDNKMGFGSAPYLAHVGLGDAVEIVRVEVTWPGDTVPNTYQADLGKTNLLVQPPRAQLAVAPRPGE